MLIKGAPGRKKLKLKCTQSPPQKRAWGRGGEIISKGHPVNKSKIGKVAAGRSGSQKNRPGEAPRWHGVLRTAKSGVVLGVYMLQALRVLVGYAGNARARDGGVCVWGKGVKKGGKKGRA